MIGQVLPQPEFRELQDGQFGAGLHPERQSGLGQRDPHGLQRAVQVDAGAVLGGLCQTRDVQSVHQSQFLQETEIRGTGPGFVDFDAVRALPCPGDQPHRNQDEGRPQFPIVELPQQAAEREIQVVGAGFLDDGLGFVGHGPQSRVVGRRRHVREQ